MKKIKYKYDEEILEETLPNKMKVYLYNTNKTRNFYITVSTKFGAEVLKYKKNDKEYDVTLGSAHFLEHRVMDFTKNKEAMDKINELGSLVNAYTTYNGTNYNIFGNENIIENMRLLFDRVFKAKIKESDVEKERGIIIEEYNMYFDEPFFVLHNILNKNMFSSSFIKYPVIGTKEGISKVKTEELKRLYNDFYTPSNMFIVVCGNFNIDEVMDFIYEYTKDMKSSNDVIKIIKEKESDKIPVIYQEVDMDLYEEKVILGYKLKIPKNFDKLKYKMIISLLINNIFSTTGSAYEELEKESIKRIGYGYESVDDYILLYFKASTDKIDEFIKITEKYINKLDITKEDLERKKRCSISSLILSFEDIMEVEDFITSEMFEYNKLLNKKEELIENITLKDVKEVISLLDFSNKSVVKVHKK